MTASIPLQPALYLLVLLLLVKPLGQKLMESTKEVDLWAGFY